MEITGRKRSHSDLTKPISLSHKRRAKTKPVSKDKDTISLAISDAGSASSFRSPNNPQATLSGLPAELRLQIYSYLCSSTIIHVHNHRDILDKSRFTWTPCRSPSPASPLLCANPKWSGMCEEEDRCTYKIYAPPEPVGFWALAASNKFIRNETQEFFFRNTVVSIHPQDLRPWLDHLAEKDSSRLENLRRITLAGPSLYRYFSNVEQQLVRDRIPKLEGLGFQCQDSFRLWTRLRVSNDLQIDREAWKRGFMVNFMKAFDPSVTIAFEAIIWQKVHRRWNPNDTEQQVAIRVIRNGQDAGDEKGTCSGSGWSDEDVTVEVEMPGTLVSKKRTAKWRQWWRGKEMKGFA